MFRFKFFFGVIKILRYITFKYHRRYFIIKLHIIIKITKKPKLISIILKTKNLKNFLDLKSQVYTYILINGKISLRRFKNKKGKKLFLVSYRFYPIKI